ncbi:MAG: ferrochelatase [Bacteroidetes bacterium]|nr:MAG: ferrochelatase [Bacteroidota bacterium]REK06524.1 MAG: ferrochelatase [Bacteroidota bacterium]REK33290.1 MAG: ferrochelatase [Bacteroidota bacterium]REK49690.1 MAG: ferrochelatase [Bacteroidota bacterium]
MDKRQKTGVLLVNLGTPDSPSRSDVKIYLTEFLNDPRVIDISPVGRYFLVNFLIIPFRSGKSAALYKQIWTDKGSPLLYYTRRQAELLQEKLGDKFVVDFAMRYRNPSIESAIAKFNSAHFQKLIILPLFPQYASASTGSVHEKVMEIVSKWQVVPDIRFINSYCDDPGFIRAFSEIGRKYPHHEHDHVLFSFHGLPERQIRKADLINHCLKENCCSTLNSNNAFCYRAQCYETARRIASVLDIPAGRYSVCFQSRLGRDPWIKPYSDDVIRERASLGDKKLLVFAPAFTSDCLETIHEIGVEYDELFREHGGQKVQMVESLNDNPLWIDALAKIAEGAAGS